MYIDRQRKKERERQRERERGRNTYCMYPKVKILTS